MPRIAMVRTRKSMMNRTSRTGFMQAKRAETMVHEKGGIRTTYTRTKELLSWTVCCYALTPNP